MSKQFKQKQKIKMGFQKTPFLGPPDSKFASAKISNKRPILKLEVVDANWMVGAYSRGRVFHDLSDGVGIYPKWGACLGVAYSRIYGIQN